MNIRPPDTRNQTAATRSVLTSLALAFLLFSLSPSAFAQRRVTRKYPAQQNVRLEMKNVSGTITVEAWDKNEILVTANVFAANDNLNPEQTDCCLHIDVVRANHGRMVGDINFNIKVPVNSTVNIETKRGNISISNVRGELVRAHISTSGDIEMFGIHVNQVIAENGMGNLTFDGELLPGGSYTFKSLSGDTVIRLPENSSFSLVANGQPQSINLNTFASPGLSFVGDGRKVYGNVGRGESRATLTILNQRGTITLVSH